jgi:hypothetical protein
MPQFLRVVVLLTSLAVSACAGDKSIQAPLTTKVLDDLPRVANSRSAPCAMQREIAKQNAYIDAIRQGRDVEYQAPCDVDKARSEPKTS